MKLLLSLYLFLVMSSPLMAQHAGPPKDEDYYDLVNQIIKNDPDSSSPNWKLMVGRGKMSEVMSEGIDSFIFTKTPNGRPLPDYIKQFKLTRKEAAYIKQQTKLNKTKIWEAAKLPHDMKLIPADSFDAIIADVWKMGEKRKAAYQKLYSKYGNCYVDISCPVFFRNNTCALVDVSHHCPSIYPAPGGSFIAETAGIYMKKNGKWTIVIALYSSIT